MLTPDLVLQLRGIDETIIEIIELGLQAQNKGGQVLRAQGKIGVWFAPALGTSETPKRQATLEAANFLLPGETMALQASGDFVRRQVNQLYKKLDHVGPPALTGFDLTFFPWQLVVQTHGVDTRPFPDLKFTVNTVYTFELSEGRVAVKVTQTVDKETGIFDFLSTLGAFFSPSNLILFSLQDQTIGMTSAPPAPGFPLGIPAKIAIPGKRKVTLTYSRVSISAGTGIVLAGQFAVVPRTPSVSIAGPALVKVELGDLPEDVTATLTAFADDVLPPVQFHWSTGGKGVMIENPAGSSTSVQFPVPQQPLQTVNYKFDAKVTDVEQLTASSQKGVGVLRLPIGKSADPGPKKPG